MTDYKIADLRNQFEVARVYMILRWLGDPSKASSLVGRRGGPIVSKTFKKFIEMLHLEAERIGLV